MALEKVKGQPVDTHEVYRSPEFRAFCERFGIAWSLLTRDMVIRLPDEGLMIVEQTYLATDEKSQNAST